MGGWWKVTLVSVCVHFLKLLDTQTHRHRNGHRAWQKSLSKIYIIPWRIFQNLTGPLKALWNYICIAHARTDKSHPPTHLALILYQASALYALRPSTFIKVLFQIKYYSCLFRKHFMRYYLMLNFLTICLLSSSKHQSFSDTTHKAQTSKLF